MNRLPHLCKNRFGVYYLRLIRQGCEVKKSLRTKDFRQAKLWALAFNLELAMAKPTVAADFDLNIENLKKLDLILPDGTQLRDIKNDEDVRLTRALMGDRLSAATPGSAPLEFPVFAPSVAAAIAAQAANSAPKRRSKPVLDVIKLYKKEKALDNTAKTIVAKERAFADF